MSYPKLNVAPTTRCRLLASSAALALIVSGAVGPFILTGGAPARAAATELASPSPSPAPSFAPLIARVKPAVVAIRVTEKSAEVTFNGRPERYRDLPPEIRRFFQEFGRNEGLPRLRPQPSVGEGSGFFISPDGYIVTDNHVIADATTVAITMDDGRILAAKVVGADPKTDLALLKVSEPGTYPYVSFAKSAPQIGDWVVAIGNPYGLGGTATAGIVSAEGRDIGAGPYDRFLQIDAPINKGNSGGPTFNMAGEVVGVNTAIVSPSGGSVGIGFAIPASTAENIIGALKEHGVVTRGYLGVMIQPVTADIAESLGMKQVGGALVDRTDPGTPAAAAGLTPGDVITKVDGQDVKDAGDLTRRIGAMKPGSQVSITLLRDGAERTVLATLGSQTGAKVALATGGADVAPKLLGVELAPAAEVAGAGDKGVAIVAVDPNGAAAAKGLKEGDVILKVSGHAVTTPDDVRDDLSAALHAGKKAVLFQVRTAAGERFVAFVLPSA